MIKMTFIMDVFQIVANPAYRSRHYKGETRSNPVDDHFVPDRFLLRSPQLPMTVRQFELKINAVKHPLYHTGE
jgi:hypothetical protein